jgi:hypothetical protein
MNVRTLLIWFFVASLLSSTSAFAQPNEAAPEKVSLRLNLQKGQTFDQVTIASEKTSEVIRGERLETFLNLRFELHFEVLDVAPDGTSTLRMTNHRISGSENLNERLIYEYDSSDTKKPVPTEAESLAAIVGQSVTLTLASNGELQKIEGASEIAEKIIARLQIPESLHQEMLSMLSQTSNDQVLRAFNNATFAPGPVGIGEKWNGEIAFQAFPVLISSEYSLLARSNGKATLGVKATIGPNLEAAKTSNAEDDARPKYSGSQTGRIEVDVETGWARNFEFHQRIVGHMAKVAMQNNEAESKVEMMQNISPIHIKVLVRGWLVAPPK